MSALCRRIAFAALEDSDTTIDRGRRFRNFNAAVNVTGADIALWLKEKPCLLLIDELNTGTEGASAVSKRELYQFLKYNFLILQCRYFVFSSHIVSITADLSNYLDVGPSNRGVNLKELPLIPSDKLRECNDMLCPVISILPLKALYNGLVPALFIENECLVFGKIQVAMSDISNRVDAEAVVNVMKCFFTGESRYIFSELLPFMNTAESGRIRWIPRHMKLFLDLFANSPKVPKWMQDILVVLTKLCSKTSGKAMKLMAGRGKSFFLQLF